MKSSLKVSESPVLFLRSEDGDTKLVNYRVKGDLYVVDRLFEEAELRVGQHDSITIERDDEKNFFERILDIF